MMEQTQGAAPRHSKRGLTLSLAVAAVMLGGAILYTVQRLSGDDCTTVTTMKPDGSQETTETCT